MLFRVFSLHPRIFDSFFATSLIARGLEKGIIKKEVVNWREDFGVGNYKQVDDSPFGGGTGMVLQPEPIYQALKKYDAVSHLFDPPKKDTVHKRIVPNNSKFYNEWLKESGVLGLIKGKEVEKTRVLTPEKLFLSPVTQKCTVSLTPRGFPINQQIVEWLANFQEINILSGRYEGFDSRVSEVVDLELSVGNYVLNGGEVAAMSLIEAVSRLVPGFIKKFESVSHDSFSSGLNYYQEQEKYVLGKKGKAVKQEDEDVYQLFKDEKWKKKVMPYIEHPQYTRPEVWQGYKVPKVLSSGNHKAIQDWRKKWW